MKRFKSFSSVIAVLLITLLMATVASAKPSSFDSSIQVQNLSSSTDANIVISFYDLSTGNLNKSINDTVSAGRSNTYFPLDVDAGFAGSVVISSDQPIAAISNIVADGFTFGASYESFSSGADTVSLPLIMKGNFGFDTLVSVQNAGTSDATVTIAYSGTACTENATIKAGAAAQFDQLTNTCLSSGYVGAAVVTGGGSDSLVATVLQIGPNQLLAYDGFIVSGSTNPVMPLVMGNNFGYFTGIQIQNTSATTDTSVTVSYTASTGTSCTETKTIAKSTSETFALSGSCTGTGISNTFIGSAAVTGNTNSVDLVAIVNQSNFSDKGSAYNAIDPATGTETVVFPLIMDKNYGYFTGFSVVNVGNASTTVTCDFVNSSGASGGSNVGTTLASNEAFGHTQSGVLTAGFVGSTTCTATGGSIVGVANELNDGTLSGDTFFTYGGFNN